MRMHDTALLKDSAKNHPVQFLTLYASFRSLGLNVPTGLTSKYPINLLLEIY